MAVNVGVISGLIEFKENLTGSIDRALGKIGELDGGMERMGQSLTRAGTAMTAGLTVPLVGIATAAVTSSIQFESAFAGVGKTVDGVMDSAGRLTPLGEEMKQAFRDMAKELPVSVEELSKIGEAAGALGIKKENIIEFTREMAMLGETTNLTSDDAAVAMARFQNIFGVEAGAGVDKLASSLVALGNAGASTEREIMEMGLRIASAGNQSGLSQAEVLALANALSSVGMNAEAGGSGISRVMKAINSDVIAGGDAVAGWAEIAGTSADKFAAAWKDNAGAALIQFLEGLKLAGDQGKDTTSMMTELGMKGIIVQDVMMRGAGAAKMFGESIGLGNQAFAEGNSAHDEFTKRAATSAAQMEVMWNKLKDVAITLGDAMVPAVIAAVDAAGPFIQALAFIAKGFAALPQPVQAIIIGFGAVVAAIGPLLAAAGMVASGIGAITTAAGIILPILGTTLPAAIATLATVLGPASVFIGALVGVYTIWKNWDKIEPIIVNVYKAVKEWLMDKFGAAVKWIGEQVGKVTGFFKDMYNKVAGNSYVPDMVEVINEEFGRLDTVMVGQAVYATSNTSAQFESMYATLEQRTPGVFQGIFDQVYGKASNFVGDLATKFGASGEVSRMFENMTGDLLDKLPKGFKGIFDGVMGKVNDFLPGFSGAFVSTIGGLFGGGTGGLQSLVSVGLSALGNLIIPGFGSILANLAPVVEAGLRWIGDKFKSFFGGIWDGLKSIGRGIADFFGFGGNSMRDVMDNANRAIDEFIRRVESGQIPVPPGWTGPVPSQPAPPDMAVPRPEGFADGTHGFRNFGRGTDVTLHGWEEVRTKPQAQAEDDVADRVARLEAVMRGLRHDLVTIVPHMTSLAVKNAFQTV